MPTDRKLSLWLPACQPSGSASWSCSPYPATGLASTPPGGGTFPSALLDGHMSLPLSHREPSDWLLVSGAPPGKSCEQRAWVQGGRRPFRDGGGTGLCQNCARIHRLCHEASS